MRNKPGDEFRCLHCHYIVSTAPLWSAVNHRNHCPYCLWSRHLDARQPGDRLSACKAQMRPVGLAFKKVAKKYLSRSLGELMLIHQCLDCGKVSINRIAADDLAATLFEVYERSLHMEVRLRKQLQSGDIRPLQAADLDAVSAQLFGRC